MVHPIMTFLNFAFVIQQTSQDRTSCEIHESSKIEGTYFSGTFCFVRLLQFKKFIMLGKELHLGLPKSRPSLGIPLSRLLEAKLNPGIWIRTLNATLKCIMKLFVSHWASLFPLILSYSINPTKQKSMKPWQTSLNKAPSKGGKEGTKREDSSLSHKSKTQSGSLHGTGTNHVLKSPPRAKSISVKEIGI